HCQPAFECVRKQNKYSRRYAQVSKYIRRADVPAADRADIDPARLRHQESGWNRAEQITNHHRHDVSHNWHSDTLWFQTRNFESVKFLAILAIDPSRRENKLMRGLKPCRWSPRFSVPLHD